MAKEYKDLVVGLDIGTAKVMAVVAEVLANGELKLAGFGVAPSQGLKPFPYTHLPLPTIGRVSMPAGGVH